MYRDALLLSVSSASSVEHSEYYVDFFLDLEVDL